MRHAPRLWRTTALLLAASLAPVAQAAPRLILQVTIDQLRADLPERYLKNMGDGGFRYLLEKGVWFDNANHGHANTETVVGHATLATGADPAVHGMIGNAWYDRNEQRLTYNVEDDRYTLLTANADVDKASEVDKSQKAATSDGRSPRRILSTTFSDELAKTSHGKARIFAVSVKDRSAVTLAGHAGKAFWFSKASGGFVSSNYYFERYPAWVNQWNDKKLAASYGETKWELLLDKSRYQFGAADDQLWEVKLPGYGRVFPHPYGKATGKLFGTLLTLSPAGDALTLDFAKTLIEAEQLGRHAVTDYLSVSFSSTDYVGHAFGPSSLEAEDNLLRVDRNLAELFAFVDTHIGLKNTLIVLSADHGTPEVPAYLRSQGIENAGYVTPNLWESHPGILALKERFGLGKELIQAYFNPYVYLNRTLIAEKGLKLDEVARAVAAELATLEGVAYALPSGELTTLMQGPLGKRPVMKLVQANYNPERSGDIYIVHEPNYFINDFDGLAVAASHGSPWSYDTHVPVVFAGTGLTPQRVERAIETVDVAVTLSAAAGAARPSGARGQVLREVVPKK